MAIAAGVGLTLVGVGVYGVIRYGVALRAREIGVRLAFGAQPQAVSRMIVREGALVVVAGLTAGLGAAMLAARLLRSQLYGIAWYDPVSYLAGTCTLLAIGLLASWLPAHRASRANPLRLLR
jgi:ABC-type antimicrobial peptide transport system permease subunit